MTPTATIATNNPATTTAEDCRPAPPRARAEAHKERLTGKGNLPKVVPQRRGLLATIGRAPDVIRGGFAPSECGHQNGSGK
jgi:hypothetical protein